MAHYKVKGSSRLTSRATTTSPEWLKVGSQIGKFVNDLSGRGDLAVFMGGEEVAGGQAVAAFYGDIAEIEINTGKAFGELTKPEFVGDFNERSTQYEFPMATGIIYHEALHAKHTAWNTAELMTQLDNLEGKAFMMLEESRIEAKGVIERPLNKEFLRASALSMALEGVDESALASLGGDKWVVANLAGLSLARYDAKVLERSDVIDIYKIVVDILGQELYEELRKIWVAFQRLDTSNLEQGVALAKRWVELLREADPEGEPQAGGSIFTESPEGQEGQEGEGAESGSGSISVTLQDLLDKMGDKAFDVELSVNDKLADQETQEKWQDEAKARQEESKSKNQKQDTARKIFDKSHNETGSGSSSRVEERRKPTGLERASAVKIGQMLDKAKYRERSVHVRKTQAPQGRLIARNAVQNKASESMGRRGELPAWKSKSRKHTDDPTLRLGVMVDISGSMSSAMEAMATTAWVMGEAGRRIQAETAMVYYGSGVFPTLRRGQRLDEVSVYSAVDGTEKFGEAWSALDGELGLTFGTGVRMVVIVSDGQYTPNENNRASAMLTECKQNGVAVLWIAPKGCYSGVARSIITSAGWGVLLDQLDVTEIALQVGKSASEALGKVGSLT
jgi:hypothetical protein